MFYESQAVMSFWFAIRFRNVFGSHKILLGQFQLYADFN